MECKPDWIGRKLWFRLTVDGAQQQGAVFDALARRLEHGPAEEAGLIVAFKGRAASVLHDRFFWCGGSSRLSVARVLAAGASIPRAQNNTRRTDPNLPA